MALAGGVCADRCARPGVLAGALDYYVLGGLGRVFGGKEALGTDDVVVGRKLASGGFGSVFRATLARPGEDARPVILKKATEFGPAEAWMNERLARAAPDHVAAFVGAFDGGGRAGAGRRPCRPSWWPPPPTRHLPSNPTHCLRAM